jgi:phospholipid/cholesterol/gamma-HCH transport system ATP-binding protein
MNQQDKIREELALIENWDPAIPLIEIEDMRKAFGDHEVLKGFNLKLFDKENLVIVGKSGSGKSVLLKCIVQLESMDSGMLKVLGQDIAELDHEKLDRIRANVGFLFQGSALYDSMTVRENLQFPLRRHPERRRGDEESSLILDALKSVGLVDAIDLMPSELSGGMKRRIALARTLILRPKIILYDEPTSGLDPITTKEIIDLILEIQQEYGTASLIITHDMDCARVISNRMIILVNGINYAEGTYHELLNSKDSNIRAFFKGA